MLSFITSAPRSKPTLDTTYQSLSTAGFTPIVFAEPGTERGSVKESYFTMHRSKLGAWHNWRETVHFACTTLLPNERALFCQDDIEIHPQALEIAETIDFPDDAACISLYLSGAYKDVPNGLTPLVGSHLWGACALLFTREGLFDYFYSHTFNNWWGCPHVGPRALQTRRRGVVNPSGIRHVDIAIGLTATELEKTIYLCSPSLVQHIGEESSLGNGPMHSKRMALDVFPFDETPTKESYSRINESSFLNVC